MNTARIRADLRRRIEHLGFVAQPLRPLQWLNVEAANVLPDPTVTSPVTVSPAAAVLVPFPLVFRFP